MQGLRVNNNSLQNKIFFFSKALIFILSLSLLSCGGGGAGDVPDKPADDTTPPVIETIKPTPGLDKVGINAFIEIKFNEIIAQYDTNNILLKYYLTNTETVPTGTVELVSKDLSFDNKTLSIKPGLLLEGTKYHIEVKNFKDSSGNVMADECQWDFATSPYVGTVSKKRVGSCGVATGPQPTTQASIPGGSYNDKQQVTLTCIDDSGAVCENIYYTLDGSIPTVKSTLYTGLITIDKLNTTMVLKYFGIDSVGVKESTKSQTYIIDTIKPSTTASPLGGLYKSSKSIVLKCIEATGLSCANIYYTLDGTIPTITSTAYTAPIAINKVNATTVLKYFGIDVLGVKEKTKSQTYRIDIAKPITTASPLGGVYNSAQSVVLNCLDSTSSSCATIYYTLDGTIPTITSTAYTAPIAINKVNATTVLKYFGIDSLGVNENTKSQTYIIDTVKPITTASPVGGLFNSSKSVVLNCIDSKGLSCANIYYTIDGTVPTINSNIYANPINISTLNSITELKYFGIGRRGINESVKVQTYTIDTIAPQTTASKLSGNYTGSVTVTLNCVDTLINSGCKSTYYTIDGSVPTRNSIVYSTALTFKDNTTFRFFSIDAANNSELTTKNSLQYSFSFSASGIKSNIVGANINSIAINPANSSKVFAATLDGGMFESTVINNTANWSFSEFSATTVNTVVYDPKNALTVYAATESGLYKSDSGGNSWRRILNEAINFIVIHPINSTNLYIGANSGIQHSINGGQSFTLKKVAGRTFTKGISINASGTILYANTLNGLYKSTNTGTTWIKIPSSNFTGASFWDVVADPSIANTVYVVGDKIYKSTNAGTTWSILSTRSYLALAVHPTNSTILYAANNGTLNGGAIAKSVDSGLTWTSSLSIKGVYNANKIVIDPTDSTVLYVGFNGAGIYRSTDSAATWAQWNTGLAAASVEAFEQDPVSPQTLYAATNAVPGIVKSTNGGLTWTDYGTYKQLPKNGFFISDISVDPNNTNSVFVSSIYLGLRYTLDSGVSWATSQFETPTIREFPKAIRIDKNNPGTLYAAVEWQTAGGGNRIYKSINNGISWVKSAVGLPASLSHKTLRIDPVNTNNLYVVSRYPAPVDLYKSSNSGTLWTALNTGITGIMSFAINPLNANELYLGTTSGKVHKSINAGITWDKNASNLIPNKFSFVRSLKVSSSNGNIMYAGTARQGIFRSNNSGIDWSPVIVSNMNSKNIVKILIDSNNDNIIYVATKGGSTWMVVLTP